MKFKKILVMILLLLYSLLAVGCASQAPAENSSKQKNGEYHKITAQEAKSRIENNPSVVIVDVRTKEEYQENHIDKALLLPLQQLTQQANTILPNKNTEILVYCRSGNRSRQAAEKLIEMGYTAVYDFGGIQDWPYKTTK